MRTAIIRSAFLLVALLSGIWSLWAGLRQWPAKPLSSIAIGILSDQTWDPATLEPVLTYLDRTEPTRTCQSSEARDAAIIRAYAVEQAYENDPPPEGSSLWDRARQEISHYLACHPHEGFFWYARFRLEQIAGRDLADALTFLEMSYKLAPYEVWVMRRRNLHAMLDFANLTPELQSLAQAEFTLLVRDSLSDAVAIIMSVEEPVQQELLASTARLPLKDRRALAEQLDSLDMLLEVPGVDYKESQPWRQ